MVNISILSSEELGYLLVILPPLRSRVTSAEVTLRDACDSLLRPVANNIESLDGPAISTIASCHTSCSQSMM